MMRCVCGLRAACGCRRKPFHTTTPGWMAARYRDASKPDSSPLDREDGAGPEFPVLVFILASGAGVNAVRHLISCTEYFLAGSGGGWRRRSRARTSSGGSGSKHARASDCAK